MGDLERHSKEVFAPTLQRSGEHKGDETPPYAPGTILGGRYRVESPLGQGGMGRVYAATHVLLGRRVAVKVLQRKYADQPAMVERFRNEARSASRMSHPNVVPVFDFGVTDANEAFLVMDLLEGEPLSDLVRRGPLALDRLLAVLHQVAMALRAAHTAGVVHRDLKPANVFLLKGSPSESLRVQVLDFGMAKLLERGAQSDGLTAAGEILGTPEYMAPEQAVSGEIDRRTDIYAFGCLAFELWCGRPPFSGPNYVTILAKQLDEKPPALGELREGPAGLEALVSRALAKNRDERPRDMDEVLSALQKIADEEGLPALAVASPGHTDAADTQPSTSRASRLSARRRIYFRRRTRRVLLASALLLAGATGGALAWRRFGPARPPSGPGTVVVTTTPPGARVTVDGRAITELSPTAVQLDQGHHVIEARLPHYRPLKEEHDVQAATSDVLRLSLQRDTYKMMVTSDPSGATVMLDGFSFGATPTTVDIDPLDPHTLRLDRLGRKPFEALISEGDHRTELHANMKKVDAE
jgi:serine/threonine-protein kinase